MAGRVGRFVRCFAEQCPDGASGCVATEQGTPFVGRIVVSGGRGGAPRRNHCGFRACSGPGGCGRCSAGGFAGVARRGPVRCAGGPFGGRDTAARRHAGCYGPQRQPAAQGGPDRPDRNPPTTRFGRDPMFGVSDTDGRQHPAGIPDRNRGSACALVRPLVVRCRRRVLCRGIRRDSPMALKRRRKKLLSEDSSFLFLQAL